MFNGLNYKRGYKQGYKDGAFEIIDRWKSLKNTSCAMCDYFMSECNGGCFSYKLKH